MYARLIKKVEGNAGEECVSCIYYGTTECRLHTGVEDCAHCPMLAAIFNQLYYYEDAMYSDKGDDVGEAPLYSALLITKD